MIGFPVRESAIPVIAECDVLIAGSTAAGVIAALAAQQQGASVFLISDRSYAGEDLTGSLSYPSLSNEARAALSTCVTGEFETLRPLEIKRALDDALLGKNIPFFFNSRPVALLEDDGGNVAGVVFAHRCAWFAIRAKQIIDATLHGLVARLDNAKIEKRESVDAVFTAMASAEETSSEPTLTVTGAAAAPCKMLVKRYVDRLSHTGIRDLAEAEQQIRHRYFSRTDTRTADRVAMIAPWQISNTAANLSVLGTASLPAADAEIAMESGTFVALAGALGARTAVEARKQDMPTGVRVRRATVGETSSTVRFGPSSTRWANCSETIVPENLAFDLLDEVDVLVVGGGTGGAPAAIGAARAGAKTLVLETLPALGGVGTLGMIGKYWFGNRVGFTAELDAGTIGAKPGESVKSAAWNTEWKMGWYLEEITKAGGKVWFGSCAFGVLMDGNRISGVLVSTPFGTGLVRAKTVIDATGNADIPAAAGAPCRTIDARHVAVQGTGLPPRQPGVGYRNTDYTFVDENDVANITQVFVAGRQKFRNEFDLSPLIDTRERRQIIGELELSPLDFLADRTFPDTVVVARSNFDTHGYTVHSAFLALAPNHKPMDARVPFRCLLPKQVDGVLATGLGVSAHRDALPVIRMQADVQNQGYAAGIAAAMAASEGKTFRELDIRSLQRRLVDTGILARQALEEEDSFPLSDDIIRDAVSQENYTHFHVSIILANPERAIPLLKARLPQGKAGSENAALLLGLMGESSAAPALMDWVAKAEWDQGWNYKGMGQFGMSLSRLDAAIVALGRTGNLQAVPILAQKIATLTADSEFSHCRAVALAACCLRSPQLAEPLARVLSLPGVSGHSWRRIEDALAATDDDSEETIPRNLSLRELVLARGLYQSGDCSSSGRRILEQYAQDLRGHYSSHAAAILAEPVDTSGPLPQEQRIAIA